MRKAALGVTVVAVVVSGLSRTSSAQPPTMSDLMVHIIYPASDAIFYIETRKPANDVEWAALQRQTEALASAADELLQPTRARGRDQWISDGRLLVDASAAAIAATKTHDVVALASLNDALYQSCVQCHQHYRPGYGMRSTASAPAASSQPPVASSQPPAARSQQPAASSQPPATSSQPPAPSPQSPAPTRSLEGTWNFSTVTPLERPAEFAGRATMTDAEARAYAARVVDQRNFDRRPESREADVAGAYNDAWYDRGIMVATAAGRHQTSLIVDPPDGRLPAQTPQAQQRIAARAAERRQHPADDPEDRSLGERCLSFNAGPPMLTGPYNNYLQIYQVPGHVILFNEMIHDARLVPIDATPQPHAAATIRRWQGDSRAHWDGAVLVVDTTNFTEKTSFRGTDENLHLVERFTRVDDKTLLYEFTIDDPTAFTRPWTVSLPMTRSTDQVYEYACHEGNYALGNILRGARDEERRQR
jgi:hypothetical protein